MFSGHSWQSAYHKLSRACLLWWTGMAGSESFGWNSDHRFMKWGSNRSFCSRVSRQWFIVYKEEYKLKKLFHKRC